MAEIAENLIILKNRYAPTSESYVVEMNTETFKKWIHL